MNATTRRPYGAGGQSPSLAMKDICFLCSKVPLCKTQKPTILRSEPCNIPDVGVRALARATARLSEIQFLGDRQAFPLVLGTSTRPSHSFQLMATG